MKLTLEFEFEVEEGDLHRVVVDIDYRPGRPPPRCHDPDHPAFSDPGDGDELELIDAHYEDGTIVPRKAWEDERFMDELYEQARKRVLSLDSHYDGEF